MRGRGSLTYRAPSAPRSTSYSDAPPSGPRAGSFSNDRGSYGGGAGYGVGRGDFSGRGDLNGAPRGGGFGRGEQSFPFRGNNSSSTTYPRTQRFNNPTPSATNTASVHLNSLEQVVPGGKLLPSGLTPEQERKLKTLEAEAERIRKELEEKQKVKREAVNEWEVRERESSTAELRATLAEEGLRSLDDDGAGDVAAF